MRKSTTSEVKIGIFYFLWAWICSIDRCPLIYPYLDIYHALTVYLKPVFIIDRVWARETKNCCGKSGLCYWLTGKIHRSWRTKEMIYKHSCWHKSESRIPNLKIVRIVKSTDIFLCGFWLISFLISWNIYQLHFVESVISLVLDDS